MRKLYCIGHRGAAGHAPENTLASVEKALAMGVDMLEVDVHAVEGELVVIHDDTLERTTNGRGSLAGQTLEQLRSLDAGDGETIPFLREIFDRVGHRAAIGIELKGPATGQPAAALAGTMVRSRGWAWEQILFSSFDYGRLEVVRDLCPAARIGVLTSKEPGKAIRVAQRLAAYALHPSRQITNRALVEEAHAAGLKVYVYTVNTAEEVARMRNIEVDGVFTDYPELVVGGADAS